MKNSAIIAVFVLVCLGCSNKTSQGSACFKGRLEIKAICMNYTLKVLEGNIDTTTIATRWIDENTGIEHRNVFALADPCDFPSTINQGDEFYFTVSDSEPANCATCKAYYPVPPKRLNIKVLSKPCP